MEIWKNPKVLIFWLIAILLFIILLIAAFYFLYKKSLENSHNLEMEKKNTELKNQFDLTKSIVKSQEAERQRIARDMHDSFIGELVRMQYRLGLNQMVTAAEIKDLVAKSRTIIHDLSPPMIDESSIDVLLEAEIIRYDNCLQYQLFKNKSRFEFYLSSDNKINIVRIFQELLQNTFKHSDAHKIRVTIYERKDNLLLIYQDICTTNSVKCFDDNNLGNGLKNIRFRNQYLKAHFKFKWIEGRGLKYSMLVKC